MRKLFAFALLLCAGLFAGAAGPVFLGTTADYITNTGGTITFVFSNRTELVFSRAAQFARVTNSTLGNPLVVNFGQGDTSSVVRLDFSFGNSQGLVPGYVWELAFSSNVFYFTTGDNKFPIYYDRVTQTLTVSNLAIPNGSISGGFLRSDASGNASWSSAPLTNGSQFILSAMGLGTNTSFYSVAGQTVPAWSVRDTNGNVFLWTSTNMSGVVRLGSNALTGVITFSNNPVTTNFSLQAGAAKPTFYMGPGGNIGIGTNAPATILVVVPPTGPATLFNSDGSLDVGSDLYIAAGNILSFRTRGRIAPAADGAFLVQNQANNDFRGFLLGGITAAFPGVGRTNGNVIISDGVITVDGTATNGLIVSGAVMGRCAQYLKTANFTLDVRDSGAWIHNGSAGALLTNTLPTAAAGLHYGAVCLVATNIAFKATGTDVIYVATTNGAAAGTLSSSNIGSTVHLFCPKAGFWVADSLLGNWTLQ